MFSFSKKTIIDCLTRETILSLALGFVVLWFGVSEIIDPANWIGYLPEFMWENPHASKAIILHGIALSAAGVMLICNWRRRLAAAALTFMLTELVVHLLIGRFAGEIIVRDIGLLGIAIALVLKK